MTLLALYGRERALRVAALPLAYLLASAILLEAAPALRRRRLEAFPPADLWVRSRSDGWLTDLAVVDAWSTALVATLAVVQLVLLALPALRRRERRRLLAHALPLALAPWVALAMLLQLGLPLAVELLQGQPLAAPGSAQSLALPYAPPLRSTRDAVLTAWLALSLATPLALLGFAAGPRPPLRAPLRLLCLVLALLLAPDRPRATLLAALYGSLVQLALLLGRARRPAVARPGAAGG